MAKLIFYDDEHIYELDGENIPSVSELSRFASREIYGEVSQYNLDNACARGSNVHKATELIDKYGTAEISDDIEPYIRAYIDFRKDYKIKNFIAIEKALASEKMKFAGTLDRVVPIDEHFAEMVNKQCKIDLSDKIGKGAIIDIKSSSKVQNVLAQIQLNAYKYLAEENNISEIGALFILHLDKEGKYKMIYFPIDDVLFKCCYTLHYALKTKKKSNKSKEK